MILICMLSVLLESNNLILGHYADIVYPSIMLAFLTEAHHTSFLWHYVIFDTICKYRHNNAFCKFIFLRQCVLVLGGINFCSHDYCVKFNTVITILYTYYSMSIYTIKVKL